MDEIIDVYYKKSSMENPADAQNLVQERVHPYKYSNGIKVKPTWELHCMLQ